MDKPGVSNSNAVKVVNVLKNVSGAVITNKNKNTLKSKYFRKDKCSVFPAATPPKIVGGKSLSEKLKSMCEKMIFPNSNIAASIPTSSEIKCNTDNESPSVFLSVQLQPESESASTSLVNTAIMTSKCDLKSDDILVKERNVALCQNSKKFKKKRFDGVPEYEVLKRTLPDLITPNLDVLIVGINPSLNAAYRQHYYAGPSNHFWKCMAMAGIVPHGTAAEDDHSMLEMGIGITNVVERTTRCQADLNKSELVEGCTKLREKIMVYKPRIVAFNGKYIYQVFSGNNKFSFGLQPGVIAEGIDAFQFVMPSSSARCSQLPRAQDKVPFFKGLKTMLDLVRGEIEKVEEDDVMFKIKLKTAVKKS